MHARAGYILGFNKILSANRSLIVISLLSVVFFSTAMDTSQDVVTSDNDTAGSSALDSSLQAESSENVEESKRTKDRQQDETVKQLYEPDFGWMKNLFKDMS